MDDPGRADEKPVKSGYPRSFEKWGIDVVRSGYTLIPNHLISLNVYLAPKSRLTSLELLVLVVIISNWWDPQLFPAASKKYIGERCGVSTRQVQRIISALEDKGLIKRMAAFDAGGASRFDLTGILGLIRSITASRISGKPIEPIQLHLPFSDDYYAVNRSVLSDRELDDEIPF